MDCRTSQRKIRQGFIQHDPVQLSSIRAHLATCSSCRTLYHELFSAEAALGARPGESSPSMTQPELELIGATLMRSRGMVRPIPRFVPYLSAAAAVLVLMLAMGRPDHLNPTHEKFTSRGRKASPGLPALISPQATELDLRLLCLSWQNGQINVRPASAEGSMQEESCQADESLGFSYRNRTRYPWHLQLLVTADHNALLYHLPEKPAPIILAPSAGNEALDLSIPLGSVKAGLITILAVFSRTPLERAEVLAVAARTDRQLPAPHDQIRLGHFTLRVRSAP